MVSKIIVGVMLLLGVAVTSRAEIQCINPAGALPTLKASLLAAGTDGDCAGKTVVVTSVLNATQSNYSTATTHGVWPSDRALKVEKGGRLAPTTKFQFGPSVKEIDPTWFYDDSGNWGPAINKAIQAASALQEIKLPAGNLPIKGTGTEIILLDRMLTFKGQGKNATLLVMSSAGSDVSTSTFAIRVSPVMDAAHGNGLNLHVSDFKITSSGAAVGGGGIYLDTTVNGSQFIAESVIEEIWVDPTVGTGTPPYIGAGIYENGNIASGTGGMFNSIIRHCTLFGGMTFAQLGDTNRFENNFLRGNGYGIDITTVNLTNGAGIGAATNVIRGNVSVSASGNIIRAYAIAPIIIDANQFEGQLANTGADNAVLAIKGNSTYSTSMPIITNNKFYQGTQTDSTYLLVDYAIAPKISGNFFAMAFSATQCALKLTVKCRGAETRENFIMINGSPSYPSWRSLVDDRTTYPLIIQDAGLGTMGLSKAITLTGGWVTYATPPLMEKTDQEWVTLSGSINAGTLTDGTQIFVVPLGYLPLGGVSILRPVSTATGLFTAELRIDSSTGAVTIYGVSTYAGVHMDLNGIKYRANPYFDI